MTDAEHTIRALRAELGDVRAALANEAEPLERDDAEAERRCSRFWFAAWKEALRQARVLRAEIAQLKEGRRG